MWILAAVGSGFLVAGIFTFFVCRPLLESLSSNALVNATALALGILTPILLASLCLLLIRPELPKAASVGSNSSDYQMSPSPRHAEATFAKLLSKSNEQNGFGLYSYLLLGSAPRDDGERTRDLTAIMAISTLPPVTEMRRYFDKEQLNITYLPLRFDVEMKLTHTDARTAEAILRAYDFARACSFLDTIDPSLRGGPYIISVLQPLGATPPVRQKYLFQDLGSVTPRVVREWIVLFKIEAAKPNFWDAEEAERFALVLRSDIDLIAHDVMPNMPSKLAELIGWQGRATDKAP